MADRGWFVTLKRCYAYPKLENQSGQFAAESGCDNIKVTAAKRHENSNSHIKCWEKYVLARLSLSLRLSLRLSLALGLPEAE